jgi:hypothetical protein
VKKPLPGTVWSQFDSGSGVDRGQQLGAVVADIVDRLADPIRVQDRRGTDAISSRTDSGSVWSVPPPASVLRRRNDLQVGPGVAVRSLK